MSRKRNPVPSYLRHASGQAYCRVNGRNVYLGPWESAESRQRYAQLLAELSTYGKPMPGAAARNELMIGELVTLYRVVAATKPRQYPRVKVALKALTDLYGATLAREFGPLGLEAVRSRLIDRGLARNYVNSLIGCIKTCWRWAVLRELLPADRHAALASLPGLERGEGGAEVPKVRPVSEEHVNAVLPHVLPPVSAMIRLQLLAGMRPGEVIIMRGCDLRMAGPAWEYRPATHKTEKLDVERIIYLGPEAQEVLKPFLKLDTQAFLFCPREAMEAHLLEKRRSLKKRKTHAPGDRYRVDSYGRAIARACKRAGVPLFHAHQLRHTCATKMRSAFGPDTARAVLGQKSLRALEVYAELDAGKAQEAARKLG